MIERVNKYGFPVSDRGALDPNDIAREVFNPYDCPLVFTSLRERERILWRSRECLPGRRRFLPHNHYSVKFKCGFKGWAKGPWGLDPKRPGSLIEVPMFFGDSYENEIKNPRVSASIEGLRKRFKHTCK